MAMLRILNDELKQKKKKKNAKRIDNVLVKKLRKMGENIVNTCKAPVSFLSVNKLVLEASEGKMQYIFYSVCLQDA